MNRGVYVSVVLTPLLLGLCFLLFAIFTEYWTRLDYSKIRRFEKNFSIIENRRNYQVKRIRLEFPKYTSLFGECNEYKLIDILEPIKIDLRKSTNDTDPILSALNQNLGLVPSLLNKESSVQFTPVATQQEENYDECFSKEECESVYQNENATCFCCSKTISYQDDVDVQCCHPSSKLCDGVSDCPDKSDELKNCPIRKLFYSNDYYDERCECQRHNYKFYELIKRLIQSAYHNNNNNKPRDSNLTNLTNLTNNNSTIANNQIANSIGLMKLFKSNNYSVIIFLLRLIILTSFAACILFTILCLIAIVFVSCCRNLREKRSSSYSDRINEFHYAMADGGGSDEDFETHRSSRVACCLCNCLLCPFAFYSAFSLLAFICCAFGLSTYLFSLCYTKYAYLIFDFEFIPEYVTQAYQYNPWLFDIQQFGISFYSLLIAFVFYLIVFISSSCISCRIQMSPAWRKRYSDSYEVLQMQEYVFNNNKLMRNDKKSSNKKNKLTTSSGVVGSFSISGGGGGGLSGSTGGGGSGSSEKKLKKKKEKEKKKLLQNRDDEQFSFSGESQALTTPKTRITAIDNSYE